MKVLALILLVANCAVLGWQYQTRVAEQAAELARRQPLPADTPRLALLAELPQLPPAKQAGAQDVPTAPASAEVKADVVAADLCIDVGPFAVASARDKLRDWLRDYAARLAMRSVTVRTNQFFWIYLEPGSETAAHANLADLRERGVTDTMLIRRGEMKNAISLGLFRSQDSVNRRLAELNSKGYQPVVVPRYETSDEFWVAAQFAAAYAEPPILPANLLGAAGVATIDCAVLAATAAVSPSSASDAAAGTIVEGLTD
jgi:hypothetical protein